MRACALFVVALGCGGVDPTEECEIAADAWADRVSTCLIDEYDVAYDAFVGPIVEWDCGNVRGIRDVDALRDECVPWIGEIECALVEDVYRDREPFPSACVDQLEP